MTPTTTYNPCLAPVRRTSPRRPERTRVVQVLATGTNGGAQEHVYNLVSRMDRDRYDVSSLMAVVHGAGPCPVAVKQAIIEWFGPVVYEY